MSVLAAGDCRACSEHGSRMAQNGSTELAGIFSSPPGLSVQTGAVQMACSWGATQSTNKEEMGPLSRTNMHHKAQNLPFVGI